MPSNKNAIHLWSISDDLSIPFYRRMHYGVLLSFQKLDRSIILKKNVIVNMTNGAAILFFPI